MPSYEYKCSICGEPFIIDMSVKRMKEFQATDNPCPYCSGVLKRVYHGSMLTMDGRVLGQQGNTNLWDASIKGLNSQAHEAAEKRRKEGDAKRIEQGKGHLALGNKKAIH